MIQGESLSSAAANPDVLACLHCKSEVPRWRSDSFCCNGCEQVYGFLHSRGLDEYYRYQDQACPVRPLDTDFSTLDQETTDELRFYLEGAHCAACVWLIEKLPELHPGVLRAELSLAHSLARITRKPGAKWSEIATELNRLGYRPHLLSLTPQDEWIKQEARRLTKRVGVAAFSTMNIMLLAVAIYGGASGKTETLFNLISFVLFAPALFYSAWPFFKNSWGALRSRTLSMDVPIAFALVVGTLTSAWNTYAERDGIYLDSLSSLIFLLLSSRLLLYRAQQSALARSRFLQFLTPHQAKRWNPERSKFETVSSDTLEPGDWVEVLLGDTIPADGVIEKGHSRLNLSVLTGEERPTPAQVGTVVFAGSINLEGPLTVRLTTRGRDSRLGQILRQIEENMGRTSRWTSFTDRVAQAFIAATLLLAAVIFLWWAPSDLHTALNRFLAIVIVACPCIFALATPLVFTLALGKSAQAGALVKGPDVFEKLVRAETIAFDKSGTLTSGEYRVLSWMHEQTAPESLEIAVALESKSNHPLARAILQDLAPHLTHPIPELEGFREIPGIGVEARLQGHHYQLKSTPPAQDSVTFPSATTSVGLFRDQKLIARFILGTQIREDAASTLEELKKRGLRLVILSGDQEEAVARVAQELGIEEFHSEMTPEKKTEWIQLHPQSVMVGDGANDAQSLQVASVGIAVRGGLDLSMRAADVTLTKNGLQPILQLIKISQETQKIVIRNLVYSFFYNAVAAFLALQGTITPLAAAVLMPVSALIVLGSTIYGFRAKGVAFQ